MHANFFQNSTWFFKFLTQHVLFFSKCSGFMDIKCDIHLCHEGHGGLEGHECHECFEGHEQDILHLRTYCNLGHITV